MKILLNENIINAAEWLKCKKELETKLNDLKNTCEHWIGYETDCYHKDGEVHYEKALICDCCGSVLNVYEDDESRKMNKIYQKQKRIFDNKYN